MTRKRLLCLPVLLSVIVLGCATAQVYMKPGINFSQYKRIAVLRFDSSFSSAVGQEVSDTIGLEFSRKGYNVIERSQLKAIIAEEQLEQYGLTEPNKIELRLAGINAIVVGSISRYDCFAHQQLIPFMGTIIPLITNNCHVSLSCKMLDVDTGELIWAANGAHSMDDVNMTANKVLQEVLKKISREIPSS